MSKELTLIGKAKFKDIDVFFEWAKDNAKKWVESHWKDHLYQRQTSFTDFMKYLKHFEELENRSIWYAEELPKNLTGIYNNMISAGTACPVYHTEDLFSIIQFGGNKKNRYFIPTEFLLIELLKDYSSIPVSQLKAIRSGSADSTNTVDNALSTVSLNDVKSAMDEKLEKMGEIKNQMEDIKNARTGELKDLQDEIKRMQDLLYEKKQNLLAEAQAKMNALEKVKSELEHQIFLLDSEIYSIRCYLGETVDFVTLRKGQPAKTETPVVLYQKLRFLDEELGRMASIYDIQYGSYEQFEAFITHNPTAFETFCPTDKCISLVKVSRTGEYFSNHYNRRDGSMENMLQVYEMEHGKMIGILIRNGENLYFGWTDEERISFGDDVFFTPGISEDPDSQNIQSTTKGEFASRYFVFSILQGVLESSSMLTLPEKQSIFMPSEYIIYSAAEGWISDMSYPTLEEVADKYNPHTREGDNILVLLHLHGYRDLYSYKRDRGRHDAYLNRTHDCDVESGIYSLNFIDEGFDKSSKNVRDENGECLKDKDGRYIYEDVNIPYKEYFISIRKGWSYKDARSNFRVYEDEFINIQFLSSLHIKYYITNDRIGSFNLGGGRSVDFPYMIKFLNQMHTWAKKREEDAAVLILPHYHSLLSMEKWQDRLVAWMFEKKVRTITEYQAKRFAKYLAETERSSI